jgi:hypothetical protein
LASLFVYRHQVSSLGVSKVLSSPEKELIVIRSWVRRGGEKNDGGLISRVRAIGGESVDQIVFQER